MTLLYYTPLLEIPELSLLEKDIEKEFGKKGIRLTKNLKLETAINPFPKIHWRKSSMSEDKKRTGTLYEIICDHNDIVGYSVKNANIYTKRLQQKANSFVSMYSTTIDFKIEKNKIIRFAFYNK